MTERGKVGKRVRHPVVALVTVLLGAGLMVACTGDEEPKPQPTGASAPPAGTGGSALAVAAQQVTQQYLTAPEPNVIATVKGTVRDGTGKDVPGTLDLLAVQARPGSTAVRWRLSTDQPIGSTSTNYYNNAIFRIPSTDAVALVAKQINLRALPGIWSRGDFNTTDCTCAYVPRKLGPDGVEMSSLYPALPENVTEIQLRVPGFPALAAPVTRN